MRHLAEGVLAAVEVKSRLDSKEFDRALATLGSASLTRTASINMPGLGGSEKVQYVSIVENHGFTAQRMSTQLYLFAYTGVTHPTLVRYLGRSVRNGIPFLRLPSAICILDRGICLIRDDGMVMQPKGDDVLYMSINDQSRSLELFMLHMLDMCLTFTWALNFRGTPEVFRLWDYVERSGIGKPVVAPGGKFVAGKIAWRDKIRMTTNRQLVEDGYAVLTD